MLDALIEKSNFQASGSLAASGVKQPQAAAAALGGGGGGGMPTGGASNSTTPVSDADADLQARLDNLRRE